MVFILLISLFFVRSGYEIYHKHGILNVYFIAESVVQAMILYCLFSLWKMR